jgi:hypothetical protein
MTQHLEHGRSLRELAVENGNCLAEAFGYSLRRSYRWLARYRLGGPASPTIRSDWRTMWSCGTSACI